MNFATIISELQFKASRSSGPGGQHVNKTSSRVSVFFELENSTGLSEEEKLRLQTKLKSNLTNEGVLVLHCETSRSQHKNKELVIEKLKATLKKALQKEKKRVPTKRTKASVYKRLESKKKQASKKESRKKPEF